jgi:hypothetical protein
MPNDQDDKRMGGIKTVSMLQMSLDKMAAKIRGLRDDNVDATPLQNAYSQAYNQYKSLVQNVGTDAQKAHPSASPDEVFGGGEAQKTYLAQGAQPIQPVVKAGLSQPSQDTISSVNSAASGQITAAQAFQGQSPEQEGPWQLPQQAPASQEAQQAVAAKQQQAMELQKAIPRAVGTSVQETASGLGSTINWLGGLFPENWPQEAFNQPRPWETSSQQYVGTGQ